MTKIINDLDPTIAVAFGKHTNTKVWQNKEIRVSHFAKKCSEPVVTNESYAEYQQMPKSEQDRIKSVGAFFGGYLPGGTRSKTNVLFRSIFTLDLDFARPEFIEDFELTYGYEAIIYSTHKHSSEKPRLRLILFPDREIRPDEYEPASRKIAEGFGIEQLDHTSFRVSQFMYWPSVSKDGEFVFKHVKGAQVDVDGILSAYRNWKDISEWPRTSRETEEIGEAVRKKKQSDPRQKEGLIGIFCRAYPTIADVIYEYLPEVYEATDIPGRWTFKAGSTYAGAVEYEEGVFIYSNHTTDPAYGKLCNVADLVRIHLYRDLDANIDNVTPMNKRPSFLALLDLIRNDEKAKKLAAAEKLANAEGDFKQAFDGQDVGYMEKLDRDRKGEPYASSENIDLIIERDPRLAGKFAWSDFDHRINVLGPLPWDDRNEPRPFEDRDMAGIRNLFGKEPYKIKAPTLIKDSFELLVIKHRYHPVRDYLHGLAWDGTPRLESLLINYLGAEDTPLVRAFTAKTFVAAVARVEEPGCKVDHILTLIGPEGVGKSTLFWKMGRMWYSSTFNFGMLTGGNGIRAIEQIQSKWIIEIAEMSGFKKVEIEAAKSFITSPSDYFRPSHKEFNVERPRQCLFVATSNNRDFLVGSTGNRRFWPVDVFVNTPNKIIGVKPDEGLTQFEIDQLWAEAFTRYKAGEKLYLDPEMEVLARGEQTAHTERDPWSEIIAQYLDTPIAENWADMDSASRINYYQNPLAPKTGIVRDRTCVSMVWREALDGQNSRLDRASANRIKAILRNTPGWEEAKDQIRIYGSSPIPGFVRSSSIRAGVGEPV